MSFGPQVAPRERLPLATVPSGSGGPPVIATFFNEVPSKNPIHCPSSETNGLRAHQ